MKYIGIVEIGTNTTKCLIVESDKKIVKVISDTVYPNRFDWDNQNFSKENNINILERIFADIQNYSGIEIYVIATHGFRNSNQTKEFITNVQTKTDYSIKVITGKEEAALSYLAIAKYTYLKNAIICVLDIGGGSSEISIGDKEKLFFQESIPLGALDCTKRFVRNDPPSAIEWQKLNSYVREIVNQLQVYSCIDVLYGVGGTVTTYALLSDRCSTKCITNIEGMRFSKNEIDEVLNHVRKIPINQRQNLLGMSAGRADIIIAGGVILKSFMDKLKKDVITVSTKGVRYGYLYNLLEDNLDSN